MENKEEEDRETVVWDLDDGPKAPLLVTILPILIFILLIICLIVKYLRKYYDKKKKSDTYIFVDHMENDDNRIDYPTLDRNDPKLNSLVFVDEKGRLPIPKRRPSKEQGLDVPDDPENVQVEASVHNSSNDTEETLINGAYEGDDQDQEDNHLGSNTDTLPLTNKKRKINTNATESDV